MIFAVRVQQCRRMNRVVIMVHWEVRLAEFSVARMHSICIVLHYLLKLSRAEMVYCINGMY